MNEGSGRSVGVRGLAVRVLSQDATHAHRATSFGREALSGFSLDLLDQDLGLLLALGGGEIRPAGERCEVERLLGDMVP